MSSNLDKIDDMAECCDIMKSFGLPTKGIKTLDEMKATLTKHLKDLKGTSTRKVGETHQVLSEAKKSDADKREKLLDLYAKAEEFLDQLDTEFIETLQASLGDFKTTLKENIESFKPRDQYIVLVAGETSAGKSSVINLILGEDLLPHSTLSTTSTICELKYGDKPKIGVHFKDSGSESREPKFHEFVTHGKESFLEQIEQFVSLGKDREKTPYKKVELFWPHPLLKEGIMIVDSPGVGESDVMSEFVLNYLPRAFCFVYVINSYNAGGIQDDRLGKILIYAQTLKKNHKLDLTLLTGCTLFVCNKWDLISGKEREEVKKEQIDKLTRRLGNLDPKSQFVYLSCKTAQLAQTYGVITGDFDDLIAGIRSLVVSSMQSNLLMYTRWLKDLLKHVSRQIRIYLKSAKMSQQETEKQIKRVMSRMQELKSSQERRFDELSQHQAQIFQEIIEKLAAHFKSEKTVKKFCEWSIDETPAALGTWRETKGEALECVSKRTHQFVQQWEDDKHEFKKAQDSLIQYCTEKYDVMKEEIFKVEEQGFLDETDADVSQDEDVTQTRHRKSTAPTWLREGLVSVVVGSPLSFSTLGAKLKELTRHKTKLESYSDNPCSYMSKRSRKCLKVLSDRDHLLPFINTQLEDAVQFLKQIKEKIPQLREGDEQFYQQLLETKRSKTEIQNIYEPLEEQIRLLQRSLTVYNVNEVRKSAFTDEELKCHESIVGEGSFSTVYKGLLSCEGQPEIKVALKRYRDPLTTNNVWHFVDEERALRKLTHPHIVKFYGTNLQHSRNGTKVLIVLELCSCSLRSWVISHPKNAPARLSSEDVKKKVLGWVLNILDALQYIHDKGFVHRDLNLDNILLTPDGEVKLAGVGVAKPEKEMTGKVGGISIYLAPEVFEDRVYNSKTDMYSFGYVLWELWYGETAFGAAIASKPQHLLLEEVTKRDLRPTHIKGTHHPWGIWQHVMTSCWNKEQSSRLTARKGLQCFQKIRVRACDVPQKKPPPPPPPRSSTSQPDSRGKTPPTKPKPPPRPKHLKATPVSYNRESEDGTAVWFELNKKE